MDSYNRYIQDIPNLQEAIEYFNSNGLAGELIPIQWHTKMVEKKWRDAQGRKIMDWRKYARLRIKDSLSGKIHPNTSEINNPSKPKQKEGLELFAEQVARLQINHTGFIEPLFEKLLCKRLIELKQELNDSDEEIKQMLYKKCDMLTGPEFRIYNFLQALKQIGNYEK